MIHPNRRRAIISTFLNDIVIDDDIVANQLREAALAEEDPELRERLWEEYRKYKGM